MQIAYYERYWPPYAQAYIYVTAERYTLEEIEMSRDRRSHGDVSMYVIFTKFYNQYTVEKLRQHRF